MPSLFGLRRTRHGPVSTEEAQNLHLTGALVVAAIAGSGTYTPPGDYAVRAGDTLQAIAQQHGVSPQALEQNNPFLDLSNIKPGMTLRVPAKLSTPADKPTTPAPTPMTQARVSTVYTVRNGDNPYTIARKLGITAHLLRAANPGVNWTRMQPGLELRVPASASVQPAALPQAPKPTGTRAYTVVSGDNDWTIASKLGVTASQVRAANPNVDWSKLKIGAVLTVPVGAKPAAAQRITTARARISRDGVYVRKGPSTSSKPLTLVDTSRTGQIVDRKGDWVKLRFNRIEGWVRADLLKPVSAAEHAREVRRQQQSAQVASRRTGTQRVASNRPEPQAQPRTRQQQAQPQTRTARRSNAPATPAAVAGSLLATAQNQLGVRYKWGGTSRSGFDCSGFVGYVYNQHGKKLPRTSREMSTTGAAVSRSELQAGDLVFFRTRRSSRINHVGIYMGDGKFIHASSAGRKVEVDRLDSGYYSRQLAGARRVTGARSKSAEGPTETKAPPPTETAAPPAAPAQ